MPEIRSVFLVKSSLNTEERKGQQECGRKDSTGRRCALGLVHKCGVAEAIDVISGQIRASAWTSANNSSDPHKTETTHPSDSIPQAHRQHRSSPAPKSRKKDEMRALHLRDSTVLSRGFDQLNGHVPLPLSLFLPASSVPPLRRSLLPSAFPHNHLGPFLILSLSRISGALARGANLFRSQHLQVLHRQAQGQAARGETQIKGTTVVDGAGEEAATDDRSDKVKRGPCSK